MTTTAPGMVDLHCHYLPGIDDGVRTAEDGLELLRGLRAVGFATVMATPHIRTAMFENRAAPLRATFEAFETRAAGEAGVPTLGLGAEHFFDDVVWELFERRELLTYPGERAVLVEFPEAAFPQGAHARFFTMQVRGVRPVLAHPERYRPVASDAERLRVLVDAGVLPLLDVMSLVGRYGQSAERTAERLLEEGLYAAACSDAHRPADVEVVARAIDRLRSLVGDEGVARLLVEGPRGILEGTAP